MKNILETTVTPPGFCSLAPWPNPRFWSQSSIVDCSSLMFLGLFGTRECWGYFFQHLHMGCETIIPNFKRIPHHRDVWLQTSPFSFLIFSVSIFCINLIPGDPWRERQKHELDQNSPEEGSQGALERLPKKSDTGCSRWLWKKKMEHCS